MRWVAVRLAGIWLVLLAAMLLSFPAAAKTYPPLSVCVQHAEPGMKPAALFADTSLFDCTTPQRRFGSGDFWVLSQPLPTLSRGSALPAVRFGSMWRASTTMYVLHEDGTIDRSGFASDEVGHFLRIGATINMPLPDRASPPVRLLWYVEGAANMRGILAEPTLVEPQDSSRTEMLFAIFYACFAGMAVSLIVYNLALWAALRQAFQPAYCLMLFCLSCYAATSSGAIGLWWPALDNNDRLRLSALFLGASGASILLFARLFFEPRVFAGWLGRISNVVTVAILASTIGFAILAPWHVTVLDRVVTISFLILAIMTPVVLVRAWRVRSNYLWLFAIAWGVPVLMASIRVAAALGVLRWNFWTDHSTIMAMSLEALLSSVGIAYRIRLLSRERDQAREQETLARELADIDPLTGLLNRRAFLRQAIGRRGTQILLLADLDHFKQVNEAVGHDGGDEVLRAFAAALVAAVPDGALVARIGGEEFAIVIDASSGVGASTIHHRLRRVRMPFDLDVTTSIGSCTGPLLWESDWKLLYRHADRALYAAKQAGRDRVLEAGSVMTAA